jgi:hypothetical protein
MNKKSKKAHVIHIVLIVLSVILGIAVIKEFSINGKQWFCAKAEVKPK